MNTLDKIVDICTDVLCIDRDTIDVDEEREDLDSLAVLQIVAEMESTLNCTVSENAIKSSEIKKISDFLKLLEK